jgi:hypothetical protein
MRIDRPKKATEMSATLGRVIYRATLYVGLTKHLDHKLQYDHLRDCSR